MDRAKVIEKPDRLHRAGFREIITKWTNSIIQTLYKTVQCVIYLSI